MALDPLATTDDLAVRLGRELSSAEEDRADALLRGASARVRTYTGQDFTAAEDDTVQVKVRNGYARLPQRPVTAVSSVETTTGNTLLHTWLNDDRVKVGTDGIDYSWAFEPLSTGINEVVVTYDHGYDEIPDDIIDVVCQMAGRALGRAPDETAVSQESIAGYSYSVGGAAAAGSMGMMADEKAALDVYKRVGGSIRVGP